MLMSLLCIISLSFSIVWLIPERGNEPSYIWYYNWKKLLKSKNPLDESSGFFFPSILIWLVLHILLYHNHMKKKMNFILIAPPLLFKMHIDLQDRQNRDYKLLSVVKIQLH